MVEIWTRDCKNCGQIEVISLNDIMNTQCSKCGSYNTEIDHQNDMGEKLTR